MSAWQTIDTAPRDGTRIDVMRDGLRFDACHFEDGGWVKRHGSPEVCCVFLRDPTHWAPIAAIAADGGTG